MNILIVDDDMAIRNGIMQIINQCSNEKHMIYEAEDGLQALKLLHESDIACVFVDVRMPIMDGIRFLEVAAPLFPDTSFVVISAYGEFEYAQKALRLGAVDYLLKPVKPDDLVNLVQNKLLKPLPARPVTSHLDPSCRLRADTKEALRLLIKDGIKISFIQNSLPLEWIHEKWNIVVIDVNAENKDFISLLNAAIRESLADFSENSCCFDGIPSFVLINSNYLSGWIDYLNRKLNAKNISFSIGISSTASSLTNLTKCYYEAQEALQYRLVIQGGIFYYNSYTAVNCVMDEQMHHLIQLVRKGSISVYENITSLVDFISECCINSPGQFFVLLDHFCIKFAAAIGKPKSNINDKLNIDSILEHLRLARSKEEVANIIRSLVEDLVHYTDVSSIDYYEQVIRQAKQYIKDHLMQDITLDNVAEAVNLSSSHLSRLFHKISGVSFITYITDLRLEEGKNLLQSGKYRIYEVANKIGYSSWKHFGRLFRQKYGLSPNEFLGKNS